MRLEFLFRRQRKAEAIEVSCRRADPRFVGAPEHLKVSKPGMREQLPMLAGA